MAYGFVDQLKSNATYIIAALVLVVIMIFAGTLQDTLQGWLGLSSPAESRRDSLWQLKTRIAEATNKKLPRTAGPGARFDSLAPGSEYLDYMKAYYTIVDLDVDPDQHPDLEARFAKRLRSFLIDGYCGNASIRPLQQEGVGFRYIFRDKDGDRIFGLTIRPADCPPADTARRSPEQ